MIINRLIRKRPIAWSINLVVVPTSVFKSTDFFYIISLWCFKPVTHQADVCYPSFCPKQLTLVGPCVTCFSADSLIHLQWGSRSDHHATHEWSASIRITETHHFIPPYVTSFNILHLVPNLMWGTGSLPVTTMSQVTVTVIITRAEQQWGTVNLTSNMFA